MTEAEWLSSTDAVAMLESLPAEPSDRKLRLFACACCRHFECVVADGAFIAAVQTAEQFADGTGSKAALKRARQAVRAVRHALPSEPAEGHREWVALWLAEVAASENAFGQVAHEILRLSSEGLLAPEPQPPMSGLLRCIFGDPFRPAGVDSNWQPPDVVSLAREIHDNRAFERLPRLAKALKDAGCNNKELLSHCRSKGPHAAGCWVVDLLLDKT